MAVDEAGALVILVREGDPVLRTSTEGDTFAETDDVERTEIDGGERFEGTITTVEGDVDITFTIEDGAADDRPTHAIQTRATTLLPRASLSVECPLWSGYARGMEPDAVLARAGARVSWG